MPEKLYTRKELVMMETYSAYFHTSFYIPEIQNHCGNTRREAFKRCSANQYVLCRRDCSERVVASFAHQIHSEYYGGNRYVSIEVIVSEHFSAPTHTET